MFGISSLKGSLKEIVYAFQFSTLIPSVIIVCGNVFFVIPQFYPEFNTDIVSNIKLLPSIITISIIISYILNQLNAFLIRFSEGIVGWDNWFMEAFKESKEAEMNELYLEYKYDNEKQQYFNTHFPESDEAILPTRLGNTMAAFEYYSKARYGIDAVGMWPRMIPILMENEFLDVVSQKKNSFDSLIYLLYVSLFLGLELTYAYFYSQKPISLLIPLFTAIIVKFLYNACINNAVQWGMSVKVAFDIYKNDLRNKLGLREPEDYDDEKELWTEVSEFILHGSEDRNYNIFKYKIQNEV